MKFGKKVSIELKDNALEAYNELNERIGEQREKGIETSEEITLWNGIQKAFDLIETNPFYGRNAKKNQIPDYYIRKYDTSNLFIVNLPSYWRMVYTLESDKVEIIAFILDIFDHKDYNKRFKFRKI
tara:strand:- start:79 stop:456 length:378 start_codon:yes stop_codon:yes gene_type:complete